MKDIKGEVFTAVGQLQRSIWVRVLDPLSILGIKYRFHKPNTQNQQRVPLSQNHCLVQTGYLVW